MIQGRVLFQGDSITDVRRWRPSRGRLDAAREYWRSLNGGAPLQPSPQQKLGGGYAFLVASVCSARYPDRSWDSDNRGANGDGILDLAQRWQEDALDLKPDLLSILVGINDASSVVLERSRPVTADAFEQAYAALLDRTRAALPQTRIVLGEPFVLEAGLIKTYWDRYRSAVPRYQAAVARLAAARNLPLIR